MNKVLFIYESDISTVSIMKNTFLSITEAKCVVFDFIYLCDVREEIIDDYNVIVFIRPMNILAWKIAANARNAGHFVITFCDDDLLNLPQDLPSIPWRKNGLLKTLNNSDMIWSSSEYIIEKYVKHTAGKRIAYIDTIITDEELEGIEVKNNSNLVKIVYAAGRGHVKLFEKYVQPIVCELVKRYGKRISFTFVGVHPNMGNVKCEYVAGMPLLEYRKYMKDNKFDIGLAPLNDNEFSKCKYFNKFIEYTTQGIVGVYSETEPYTYVVKNGENGYLAKNTPDGWLTALCKAIDDKEKRKECLEAAIDYLKENHSEKTIVNRMLNEIPELKNNNCNYLKCRPFGVQKIVYNISRPFDWLYLTVFYLLHNGWADVVNRIYRRAKGINVYGGRQRKSHVRKNSMDG